MDDAKNSDKLKNYLRIVSIIGFALIIIRTLLYTKYDRTGLLYIAVPFTISWAIYYFIPHTDGSNLLKRLSNHIRTNLIILLSVSLILMEGYICVIMLMPIYFFISMASFISAELIRKKSSSKSVKVYVLPLIIILTSLEGTSSFTTFNRYNEVTHSKIINADIPAIKKMLSAPRKLEGKRHFLVSIFPLPTNIVDSVVLKEGNKRKYDFIYHRWITGNTHKGSMVMTIDKVADNYIKTNISDESYLSNYLKFHSSEIKFEPINRSSTRVSLTISFDRLLDPSWYFQPLERFAVKKGLEFYLNQITNTKNI